MTYIEFIMITLGGFFFFTMTVCLIGFLLSFNPVGKIKKAFGKQK